MTFLFGLAIGGVGVLACTSLLKMLLDDRLDVEDRIAHFLVALFYSLVIWLLVFGYAATAVQP